MMTLRCETYYRLRVSDEATVVLGRISCVGARCIAAENTTRRRRSTAMN